MALDNQRFQTNSSNNSNSRKTNTASISLKAALKHIGAKHIVAMVLSIVAAVCVVLAVSLPLYNSMKNGVDLRGEYVTDQASDSLEQYLMSGRNSLLLSGFVVNQMLQMNASTEEIYRFIAEESERMVESIDNNFKGLYGWFNGEYLTTTGFVPDSTFHPKERPWYIRAMEGKGELVYVDPYLDANTGTVVMTLAKALGDGESVIALDVTLGEIQRIVENAAAELEIGEVMVLDEKGGVVAHSIQAEIGHSYGDPHQTAENSPPAAENSPPAAENSPQAAENAPQPEDNSHQAEDKQPQPAEDSPQPNEDTLGKHIADIIYSENPSRFEVPFHGRTYVVYNIENEGSWHTVSALDANEFYSGLYTMIAVSCILVVLIITIIFIIFIRNTMRNIVSRNLTLQLSAIADVYTNVIDINLPEDSFIEIINRENLEGVLINSSNQAQASLYAAVDKLASKTFRPILKEFLDFSTLSSRLEGRTTIALEFQDVARGWCRGRMIVAERDRQGHAVRVLWAIESIDEERRRRDELIHLAETDQMTGILNRASGEHKTQENISLGKGGMFMMIDIDHFKSINDRFGHQVGDQVIILVAECLRRAFRHGDIVMRLGGDEFAAYAPGVTTRTISDRIVERFLVYLGKSSVPEMQGEPIHVSIGIAFCPKDGDMSFRKIYERADQSVYQSKKTEGNQITYSQTQQSPQEQ